ncbi:MAG: hypothetical protein ACOYL3_04095 [Desulfuromonadaceae bacterium]
MTVIYLLILFTPLTLHSRMVAHAITGECSGSCEIDGCSLESRSAHSCCCAQKHQARAEKTAIAGSVGGAESTGKPGRNCCPPQRPAVAKNSCCAKNGTPHRQENSDQTAAPGTEEQSKHQVVLKCGSPCGKGKIQLLAAAGSSDVLPYIYAEKMIEPPHKETRYSPLTRRMASRHAEPPDPPPRLLPVYS